MYENVMIFVFSSGILALLYALLEIFLDQKTGSGE